MDFATAANLEPHLDSLGPNYPLSWIAIWLTSVVAAGEKAGLGHFIRVRHPPHVSVLRAATEKMTALLRLDLWTK